jgi:hypothetical protein
MGFMKRRSLRGALIVVGVALCIGATILVLSFHSMQVRHTPSPMHDLYVLEAGIKMYTANTGQFPSSLDELLNDDDASIWLGQSLSNDLREGLAGFSYSRIGSNSVQVTDAKGRVLIIHSPENASSNSR